jgi:hypothetical protein
MQRGNQKPRNNRKYLDIGARTPSVRGTINPLNEPRLIFAKLRSN